jgi:hypothetical protein
MLGPPDYMRKRSDQGHLTMVSVRRLNRPIVIGTAFLLLLFSLVGFIALARLVPQDTHANLTFLVPAVIRTPAAGQAALRRVIGTPSDPSTPEPGDIKNIGATDTDSWSQPLVNLEVLHSLRSMLPGDRQVKQGIHDRRHDAAAPKHGLSGSLSSPYRGATTQSTTTASAATGNLHLGNSHGAPESVGTLPRAGQEIRNASQSHASMSDDIESTAESHSDSERWEASGSSPEVNQEIEQVEERSPEVYQEIEQAEERSDAAADEHPAYVIPWPQESGILVSPTPPGAPCILN